VRAHPVVTSLVVILGATAVAFLAALAVDRALDLGSVATSLAVALTTAGLFSWRAPEGLLGFLISALLAGTVEHWAGLDLRYVDELAIPALVVLTVTIHRQRIVLPPAGVRELALASLVVAAVVSSLANDVPASLWVPGLGLLLKGFAFFYVVLLLRLDGDELMRVVGVALPISVAIAAIGFLQFVNPALADSLFHLPPFARERGQIAVVNSLFTHPALFGWLTAITSLFLYARFVVMRSRWSLVAALGMGIGTVISGRRTPVIGLLAATVLGVIRESTSGRAAGRLWASAAGVVIVLALISIPVLGGFYRDTLTIYGAPPEVIAEVFAETPDPLVVAALQPRVALYAGAVAIARDELPFGAGIGRFGSHMSREVYSPAYPRYGLDQIYGLSRAFPIAVTDTFWPMILGETGIIGLVACLVFFGVVGRDLWRAAGLVTPPEARFLLLGALLVSAEGIIRSLTSAVFVAPPIAYFAFGVAAMALGLAGRFSRSAEASQSRSQTG
jgi:hypothetical protein